MSLKIQEWNKKYLLKELTRKFNEKGFNLYLVGGFVRDTIMGRETHDIDMTTDALPQDTKEILEELGSIYTVGKEFGTIGLNLDGQTIEVTTFRKEVYPTESRKPIVEWGTSLVDDLARRDFTINSIARNELTGEIIDPFGGIEDIRKKVVRVVGSNDRFNEDPLRMLRAIRLACELNFKLHINISHPERIKIVSKERVRDELVKILLSRKPTFGIRKLCKIGLMQYIIPEFVELKNVAQGKNHIKDAFEHSLLVLYKGSHIDHNERNLAFRLACLLHDIGKSDTKIIDDDGVHFYGHHSVGARKVRKILCRLHFDSNIVEDVAMLVKYHMTPIMLQREIVKGKIKKRIIMRLVRRVGVSNIYLLLDLVKCDIRSSKNPRYKFVTILTRLVNECMAEKPETLVSPIDGHEIMKEFNLKPGVFIGEVKNYLTNLVIDGKLKKGDREGAYAEARRYIYNKRRKVGVA